MVQNQIFLTFIHRFGLAAASKEILFLEVILGTSISEQSHNKFVRITDETARHISK